MKSINDLAKKIAANEGLKKETSIAQIREILKWTAIILSDDQEMKEAFLKYGAKKSKELSKTKGSL